MASAKRKILIIEDETALLYALQARLSLEGYEVVSASSGELGLNYLAKEPFDLVILDLVLPGMTGFEVLKKLKQDKKFSKIPVVVISNLDQEDKIKQAYNLGAQDFLAKSHYNLDDLIQKIKRQLNEK